MDRRNFFKLVGTASGGALTGACGKEAAELLPILVPEREIVPGIEQWRPSVCRECSAGCGTLVRIMEAEREIELDGERVRERVAAIKKIEGNPLDPVSGGRLCARGQATVQALYHPDRLRGPRKRTGERGEAAFRDASWGAALEEAARVIGEAVLQNPQSIVYLSRPETGTRAATVARFLRALGADPASTCGQGDFGVERRAAEIVYGWQGIPQYEIQDATYVLGLGADFLGGWVSPVLYARRFGHLRRGRPGLRGRLVHAESRFSQTAWSADQWLPVRPGGELALALALGHVLLEEGLAPAPDLLSAAARESYRSLDVERAARIAGIELRRIRRVARELAEAAAPLVVAGASIVQANSVYAVAAASGLNLLLGNVGKPGGVHPPAPDPFEAFAESRPGYRNPIERLQGAEVIILDGVNPVYTLPTAAKALAEARLVLSFSPFLDDSTAYADLILPDHAPLEAAAAVVPETAPGPSLTGSRAFVQPLYDTRATEQVLAELAKKIGKPIEVETPEKAFRRIFDERKIQDDWSGAQEFAQYHERQGGWWGEPSAISSAPAAFAASIPLGESAFEGDNRQYPFVFQPYPSLQFGNGSGAHLPWLQETPDPTSSAMWGLPVEIDPATAARLGITNGDLVRVTSPAGELEAPAYVHPAAIPGVVSMAIGQGHAHYGRYASGRGANPLAIVAPVFERQSGAPAFGATRVKLEKVGKKGRLVQFAPVDREGHAERL